MTTEMLIENPQITLNGLNEIYEKVNNNTASAKDYQDLDSFLSHFNLQNYILDKMRQRGFISYQDFINYRKKPALQKNLSFEEGVILGVIKECVTMLKNSLTV